MSERSPHRTFKNETTRESGLIVPAGYGDGEDGPKITTPTPVEVQKYGVSREAAPSVSEKEEQSFEIHRQAYEDILNPEHIISLKEAIESAQSKLGTSSTNVNKGLDLKSASVKINEDYIEEYLHTGDREKLRPIPDELRSKLERMLKMSFSQLGEMIESPTESVMREYNEDPEPSPKKEPDTSSDSLTSPTEVAGPLNTPDDEPAVLPATPPPAINENDEPATAPTAVIEPHDKKPTKKSLVEQERKEVDRNMAIQKEIESADRIFGRRKRARALASIALKYESIEAAETILTSKRKYINPFRAFGSDKSEHDRALAEIAKQNSPNSREAALKIKRGSARNKALHNLGDQSTGKVEDIIADSIDISRDMHGAGSRRERVELIEKAALKMENSKDAVKLVKQEIKFVPTRDKVFQQIAIKFKDHDVLKEIKNPIIRNKTRVLIASSD